MTDALIQATTWLNLGSTVLTATKDHIQYRLHEISRKGKSRETENKTVVAWGLTGVKKRGGGNEE